MYRVCFMRSCHGLTVVHSETPSVYSHPSFCLLSHLLHCIFLLASSRIHSRTFSLSGKPASPFGGYEFNEIHNYRLLPLFAGINLPTPKHTHSCSHTLYYAARQRHERYDNRITQHGLVLQFTFLEAALN